MRLKLSRFRRNFNKDLPIEFTEQNLSSFGGLELFSRYLRRVELSRRVGKACRGKGIRSDYGSVRLVLETRSRELPWCITLDNSKGISRLRFWAKNRRVNGINDLPVFMHQGTPMVG